MTEQQLNDLEDSELHAITAQWSTSLPSIAPISKSKKPAKKKGKKSKLAIHHSSKNMKWLTPPKETALVREFMPIIDLDPSANKENSVGAKSFLTEESPDGGGLGTWPVSRNVFSNPTYGRSIPKWIASYKANFRMNRFRHLIALMPARPDTKWFDDACESANAICFYRGRIIFLDNETGKPCLDDKGRPMPAPFPVAWYYWGSLALKFEYVFSRVGRVWQLGDTQLELEL